MAEDFYEHPRHEVCQGDIIELTPNALLKHPLRALAVTGEGTYAEEHSPYSSLDGKDGQAIASCRRSRAILLTCDCEIDKPATKTWIVSPVVPLAELPGAQHNQIKKNAQFSYLYLPKHREILPESVIVLNHATTLDKNLAASAKRILSLSDLGRRSMYLQYIRWLTRWQLGEVHCPNCRAIFSAADGMAVRPD